MGWFYFDFYCDVCDFTFEAMVNSNSPEITEPCKKCEKDAKKIVGGTNNLWSNDPDKASTMLKKRSIDHTRREQKKGNILSPRALRGK